MSDPFRWKKMKKRDSSSVEILLRAMESRCVSACGRFLIRDESDDPVWTLRGKDGELSGLLISSRSTLIPVLCGREIPFPRFLGGFFLRKKIHSVQGLRQEVVVFQDALEKMGRKIADIFDYDLMSLDRQPDPKGFLSGPSNLVLRVPRMTDLDAIAPLQAAYEQEEVLPKGSTFSPASSRVNIANIVSRTQVLIAEICGRIVGKINISAVSYTRYQVGGVYVHPDFRGLGIARRMATEFTASLINEGRGVTLFVKKTNLAARRLYTSLGFSVGDDYRITYY
jgi:RimJ/RimL family protein N-acetyltransferase